MTVGIGKPIAVQVIEREFPSFGGKNRIGSIVGGSKKAIKTI